jgi:hypothetical protein
MQTINKVLHDDNLRSSASEQNVNLADPRIMNRLWLRMTEIYGHQWTSQFGDEPAEAWCRMLAGVPPDLIAVALGRLSERTGEWPPNAAEFRNLCKKPSISPNGINAAAYRPANPQLTKIKSDQATGSARLAVLRELLAT